MRALLHSCYSDVSRTCVTERELLLEQINRLVGSHALHGSESLCKLLRYLAKHAVDHPGTPIKEFQIATEVFGRSTDFDPQLDSMVRVQAGRLRAKLTEYYSTEGASDPLVVELPKGSYALIFHARSRLVNSAGTTAEVRESVEKVRERSPSLWLIPFLATALLIALATIGWLVLNRRGQ